MNRSTSGPNRADRIYHLAVAAEWTAAQMSGGPYDRSTLGRSLDEVGFIHCSFADQVQGTADLIYGGRDDVVVLAIDPALLHVAVRVENVGGAPQPFPHVYGPIVLDAVTAFGAVALGPDGGLAVASALTALGEAPEPGKP